MSDVRILQVNVGTLPNDEAMRYCNMLVDKLPDDILIVPHRGDEGKLTAINIDNVYDIHFTNVNEVADNINVTGEELYESIRNLIRSKRGEG